jgi:hypothetical protein
MTRSSVDADMAEQALLTHPDKKLSVLSPLIHFCRDFSS